MSIIGWVGKYAQQLIVGGRHSLGSVGVNTENLLGQEQELEQELASHIGPVAPRSTSGAVGGFVQSHPGIAYLASTADFDARVLANW
jgi:hypothetical protein